jgi:hypothetical protein
MSWLLRLLDGVGPSVVQRAIHTLAGTPSFHTFFELPRQVVSHPRESVGWAGEVATQHLATHNLIAPWDIGRGKQSIEVGREMLASLPYVSRKGYRPPFAVPAQLVEAWQLNLPAPETKTRQQPHHLPKSFHLLDRAGALAGGASGAPGRRPGPPLGIALRFDHLLLAHWPVLDDTVDPYIVRVAPSLQIGKMDGQARLGMFSTRIVQAYLPTPGGTLTPPVSRVVPSRCTPAADARPSVGRHGHRRGRHGDRAAGTPQ